MLYRKFTRFITMFGIQSSSFVKRLSEKIENGIYTTWK